MTGRYLRIATVLLAIDSLMNLATHNWTPATVFGVAALALVYQLNQEVNMVKTFETANPVKQPTVDFDLKVWRDGEQETHRFTARPVMDAGAMLQFSRSGDDGEKKAAAVFRMMARMLVNTDGVPDQWSAKPLDKPANAGSNWVQKFRDPSGKLQPMSKASLFTDPTKGSSRRRWNYLMFEDDGAVVDIEVISEIIMWLASEVAEVPTSG